MLRTALQTALQPVFLGEAHHCRTGGNGAATSTYAPTGIAAVAPTRFFRQCAPGAIAATKPHRALTVLAARVSVISDIRLGCHGPKPRLPGRFTFKPLDLVICVQRACRLARCVMPPAWLRVLIKE
jgi:hypothetical protein